MIFFCARGRIAGAPCPEMLRAAEGDEMTHAGALAQLLHRVRTRMRLQRALDALGLWGVLGMTLAGPGVIRLRLFGWQDRLGWGACIAALLLPLMAAGWVALGRLSLKRVAAELDRRLQLRELLGSAWEFATGSGAEDRFRLATIARAEATATGLQPNQLAPLRLARTYWAWPCLLLGLLASARLQPTAARNAAPPSAAKPARSSRGIEARAALAALAAETSDQVGGDVQALTAELNELIALVQRDAIEPLALLRRLQAFDQRTGRALAGPIHMLEQTRELGAGLRAEPGSRDLGAALAETDFARAQVALQDLARRASGPRGAVDTERFHEAVREALLRHEKGQQAKREQRQRRLDSLDRERERATQNPAHARPSETTAREQAADADRQAPAADGGGHDAAAVAARSDTAADAFRRRLEELSRKPAERAQAVRDLKAAESALAPLEQAQAERRSLEQLESQANELRRIAAAAPQTSEPTKSESDAANKPQALSLSRFAQQAEKTPSADPAQPNMSREGSGTPRQAGPPQANQNDASGAPDDAIGGAVLGRASASAAAGKDTRVLGRDGAGPSRSAVIQAAADSGFATRAYRRVHADYLAHAESELAREDLSPGYRAYVRRYFLLIRPRAAPEQEDNQP
jgi:hypothetical protein